MTFQNDKASIPDNIVSACENSIRYTTKRLTTLKCLLGLHHFILERLKSYATRDDMFYPAILLFDIVHQ